MLFADASDYLCTPLASGTKERHPAVWARLRHGHTGGKLAYNLAVFVLETMRALACILTRTSFVSGRLSQLHQCEDWADSVKTEFGVERFVNNECNLYTASDWH